MNYCPDCGAKNESNADFCPLCGYALNSNTSNTAMLAKDQKIRELEQKIYQLEHRLQTQPRARRPSAIPENFPFWIIPVTIIAFFGMFALIIFIMVSR